MNFSILSLLIGLDQRQAINGEDVFESLFSFFFLALSSLKVSNSFPSRQSTW